MRYLIIISLFLLLLPLSATEPTVLLAAVGDVMPARTVTARITAHGPAWAWEEITPYLIQADLRFCNLESAVSTCGRAIPKPYSFRVEPKLTIGLLEAAHIDVASLANNHTYDYGRTALKETIETLETAKIVAPGAGIGRAGAIAPRMVTCNGLKLAFVAYTSWTPEGYLPADDAPALATLDEKTLTAELKAAKGDADLLIMSIHWGKEYSPAPTSSQQRVAHLAIDAGADLVIGHHPHVAEPVEVYRDRPILYSLGNCIFDRSGHFWSNGMLAMIRLTKSHVVVEQQIPLLLEDARPIPNKKPQSGGAK